MSEIGARLAGAELYFDDLRKAKDFYQETPGLKITSEEMGHHAQFDSDTRHDREGANCAIGTFLGRASRS